MTGLNRFFIFKRSGIPEMKLSSNNVGETTAFENKISPTSQLARIGTIPDGGCFYHSILTLTSDEYSKASETKKGEIMTELRNRLADSLTREKYDILGNGAVAKLNLDTRLFKKVKDKSLHKIG